MAGLHAHFVSPQATLKEAMDVIDKSAGKIALVVDPQQKLLGTVTDGDIRRAVLNEHPLSAPVQNIMKTAPFTASIEEDRARLFSLMQARNIRNIPIVDAQGRLVDLINLSDILTPKTIDNRVVIMAGGLGKRLMPLTKDMPKPMLEVGGTPVLEILLNSFISQGFNRFYISVNYLADKIKDHFKDGHQYGVDIQYLEEDRPLDTAGALSLLSDKPKRPFFVINGDILTNIRFQDMLDFHVNNKAAATIGVREHKVQIPYGVVTIDDFKVMELKEKPQESYFVNTGIYVLNPEMLDFTSAGQAMTMPELLQKAQERKSHVVAYPVTEYWLDIGRMEDFSRAEKDFSQKVNF